MATRIVFTGNSEVVVSQASEEVAAALGDAAREAGFASFERDRKGDVVINPANVLYLEHIEVQAIRRSLPD